MPSFAGKQFRMIEQEWKEEWRFESKFDRRMTPMHMMENW